MSSNCWNFSSTYCLFKNFTLSIVIWFCGFFWWYVFKFPFTKDQCSPMFIGQLDIAFVKRQFTLFFFKDLFIYLFYWRIIALQWCVSFCFITKWISYTYTYIPTSPILFTFNNKSCIVKFIFFCGSSRWPLAVFWLTSVWRSLSGIYFTSQPSQWQMLWHDRMADTLYTETKTQLYTLYCSLKQSFSFSIWKCFLAL